MHIPQLTNSTLKLPPLDAAMAREVWHDNDGTICALAGHFGDWHRMDIPGVGSFLFHPSQNRVTVTAEAETPDALVQDAYLRMVLPMLLQVSEQEVLHGSAVLTPHGVLALCARSETGKSTLAYGLVNRGLEPWADDAVVFDSSADPVQLLPTPFAVRLRPVSAQFFGQVSQPDNHTIGWHRPTRANPALLAAICLLERLPPTRERPITEVTQLSPSQAFSALLAHAYAFDLSNPERKRRMMQRYLALAQRAPVFTFRFQSGLDNLDEILDALEQTICGLSV